MISLSALWYCQGGICFYCGRETWIVDGQPFAIHMQRLGVRERKQLMRRAATREHLVRKADGGSNDSANIIMACQDCNLGRQTTPALLHLAAMRAKFACLPC